MDNRLGTPLLPVTVWKSAKNLPKRHCVNNKLVIIVCFVVLLSLLITSRYQHVFIQSTIHETSIKVSSDGYIVKKTEKTMPQTTLVKTTSEPDNTSMKSTTPRYWRPGTTKSASKQVQVNFQQLSETVVVVRRTEDVQLDCKITYIPNNRISPIEWYRGDEKFLTMANKTYVDDDRIYVFYDDQELNWALRISSVTLEDSDTYTCRASEGADIVSIVLEVLPLNESVTPQPAKLPDYVYDQYEAGFVDDPSPAVCPEQGSNTHVAIAVISFLSYIKDRQRIRATWAGAAKDQTVTVVFSIGYGINPGTLEKMQAEAKEYGDLVFGNFQYLHTDNVETLKLINALEWSAKHCPLANYTLVVTHKQFVNVQLLLSTVDSFESDQPAIYCHRVTDRGTVRDPSSEQYVPYNAYQRRHLPPWCAGPAVLVSRAAVPLLYQQALTQRLLPGGEVAADILVTGLAAEAAGVERRHMEHIYKKQLRVETCEYNQYLTGNTWGPEKGNMVMRRIADDVKCP